MNELYAFHDRRYPKHISSKKQQKTKGQKTKKYKRKSQNNKIVKIHKKLDLMKQFFGG